MVEFRNPGSGVSGTDEVCCRSHHCLRLADQKATAPTSVFLSTDRSDHFSRPKSPLCPSHQGSCRCPEQQRGQARPAFKYFSTFQPVVNWILGQWKEMGEALPLIIMSEYNIRTATRSERIITWKTQAEEESELSRFVLTCLPHSLSLSYVHNVLRQRLEKCLLVFLF